ncbi:DUF5808 domain-containing protein [Actinoplanes sp. Pm04-4]|uniref:DUF5808 domain-containing protein n=1 Tax=Paractinoplanes pyxinae TaxID=2997416 RepID=A0ABT4B7T4_9ACTN|nr:DUF5808 domain-containing protein [Actinoplanes pyxinae]MCY1142567.1 DUF5808 domain-containing protein [Actinoplanes pyxinae]
MTGWQGWFYSDPRDPRLLVPRRSGLGLTLNFGHPAAWWVLGGILAVMVVIAVLGTLLEAR